MRASGMSTMVSCVYLDRGFVFLNVLSVKATSESFNPHLRGWWHVLRIIEWITRIINLGLRLLGLLDLLGLEIPGIFFANNLFRIYDRWRDRT